MSCGVMASEYGVNPTVGNNADVAQIKNVNFDVDRAEILIVELCTQNVIVYCGDVTEVIPITTDCRFIDAVVSDFIDMYFAACDQEEDAPERPLINVTPSHFV